jgi:hypothetical protein
MLFQRRAHISQCGPGDYVKLAKPSRRAWAWLVCPGCKRGVSVAHNHEVLADGTVTPSFVCTHGGCTYHQCIKLGGWEVP